VNQHPVFRHTKDIIAAADNRRLPSPLIITIHPRRWTDKPLPWFWELLWQNTKNVVKAYRIRRLKKKKADANETQVSVFDFRHR
jgi:hypothetical protein